MEAPAFYLSWNQTSSAHNDASLWIEWIRYVIYCICAVTVIVLLFHCFHGLFKRCRQNSKTAEVTLEVGNSSNPDRSTEQTKDGRHSSSAVPQENNSVRMSSFYQSLIPSTSERQSIYESLDQEGTQLPDIYENFL